MNKDTHTNNINIKIHLHTQTYRHRYTRKSEQIQNKHIRSTDTQKSTHLTYIHTQI